MEEDHTHNVLSQKTKQFLDKRNTHNVNSSIESEEIVAFSSECPFSYDSYLQTILLSIVYLSSSIKIFSCQHVLNNLRHLVKERLYQMVDKESQ